MRGAGGSEGGTGAFLIGIVMMCGGFYLLLNSIVISSRFGFGNTLYSMGGIGITGGIIMIPFLFGVGMIFFNSRNALGWVLSIGSAVSLIFGVISSIDFSLQRMSAFELMVILVLAFGGTGLFLRSLRTQGIA